jgi:PAS domain S-box-containing protein
MGLSGISDISFQSLFESAPALLLVIRPDAAFTIVAVSDAYLKATMTRRGEILGRGIFDVFPDNPADPISRVASLRASLDRVVRDRVTDVMALQKYDIARPAEEGGGFEERFWSPINAPVISDGELEYIIHRVEDVTQFVRSRQATQKDHESRDARVEQMETDLFTRAQEIRQANNELSLANERLRVMEERFRLLVESAKEYAIFVLDTQGNIQTWNSGAERIKGYTADEIIGQHFSKFYPLEDVASGKPARELRIVLETGYYQEEGWRIRKDGSRFWANVGIGCLRDAAGTHIGFSKITRDLTDRKQAEDAIHSMNVALQRQNAQLASANEELEAFSYSVSHDLRAPLRSLDGFSQALLEDYADRLDDEGKDYLQRVRAASQRMGVLIDALLGLSRFNRMEIQRLPVDLSQLAAEVAQELRSANSGRSVQIDIAPTPPAHCDPRLMRVVLANLLGNAWKFSANQPQPRIEFGTATNAGDKAYFVRDNGAGFDMAYADKLFGAFQRLHATNDFPGTGIGLATVARIIRRHGGKVWAEGRVGQGATFYFTV